MRDGCGLAYRGGHVLAAREGFTASAGLAPDRWTPPWDAEADPDGAWLIPDLAGDACHETGGRVPLDDSAVLEPARGSGSFLAETLRRELRLVSKDVCATQEQCVHRLLRAAASIHGVEQRPVRCRGRVRPGPQCRGPAVPAGCGGGGAEDVVRVEVAARARVRPGLPVRARPSGESSLRVCHGMPYGATESRCDGSGILEFPGTLPG